MNILAIHNYAEWGWRSVELADRFTHVDARASDTHVPPDNLADCIHNSTRKREILVSHGNNKWLLQLLSVPKTFSENNCRTKVAQNSHHVMSKMLSIRCKSRKKNYNSYDKSLLCFLAIYKTYYPKYIRPGVHLQPSTWIQLIVRRLIQKIEN